MKVDPRLSGITDALYRVSAKALIIDSNKILVTQEGGDEWWSLPGGGVDYNEDVVSALKRELEEEIGIPQHEVQSDWKVRLVSLNGIIDGIPRANIYYIVKVPIEKIKKTDDILDYKWVTGADLSKLYISPSMGSVLNEIIDIVG